METEHATVSPIDRREKDRRAQALELYRTTDLAVADIASQVRASRWTVYRWLHREGITVGSTANNIAAGRAREQIETSIPVRQVEQVRDEQIGTSISVRQVEQVRDMKSEIAELRREQTALIGRLRRLEGLIEGLLALKSQAV
jgi:hypothetical protein